MVIVLYIAEFRLPIFYVDRIYDFTMRNNSGSQTLTLDLSTTRKINKRRPTVAKC